MLEVPLIDLRENPITQLPAQLSAVASLLGEGAILSDLLGHDRSQKERQQQQQQQGICGGAAANRDGGGDAAAARGGQADRGERERETPGCGAAATAATDAAESSAAGAVSDESVSLTTSAVREVKKEQLAAEHVYKYSGSVKDNREHGKGKRIFRDASILECEYVQGKLKASYTSS
jgi:hypothetical protein